MDPITISAALEAFLSNPAVLASLGSLAAGTYFKGQARDDVVGEQARVMAAERARQQGIDAQRAAAMAATQGNFTPQNQVDQQQSIAAKLAQRLTPQERPAVSGEYNATNPGAPKEVQDRAAAVNADALAKGQDYAKRLSNLSSYNLLNFGNSVQMNRLGENVGQLNSAALRSSQITPIELEAAKRAGRGNEMLADLANGAGSIAMMYGASTMGKPTTVPGGDGGGLKLPGDMGMDPTRIRVPATTGIDLSRAGVGARAAGVPRLVF